MQYWNIMTIIRALAVAVVFASVAMGSASPAHAIEPLPDGLYSYTEPGLTPSTWKVSSLCTLTPALDRPDPAADTQTANGCVQGISNFVAPSVIDHHQGRVAAYSGSSQVTAGQWKFTVKKSEGTTCPDGSYAPSVDTYAFDDVTLTGTHTSAHDEVCGLQPGLTKQPFTLAFLRPLDAPIERYPLVCDHNAVIPTCY